MGGVPCRKPLAFADFVTSMGADMTGRRMLMGSIEARILLLRGQKVMLDADLAELYGVETKRLNEQVRRNIERFPEDFMFRLTAEEKAEVVANCDHLAKLKYSASLPYAFTEHGALMLGNVLKSARAVEMSLRVVRAFVHLRELLAPTRSLPTNLTNWSAKSAATIRPSRDGCTRYGSLCRPPKQESVPLALRRGGNHEIY